MPTVRVNDTTHKALRDLAESERISLQTVVERAIEHYRRQRFLEAVNKQFAALRCDSSSWAQEQDERDIWG